MMGREEGTGDEVECGGNGDVEVGVWGHQAGQNKE